MLINPISPYVYCGINRITHEIYYGVGYGNVRLCLSPKEDLRTKYFTSSKYAQELLERSHIIQKNFEKNILKL
jgi:hypothetical protein